MPNKRGEFHSPERAAQLRDFSGLLYGNITPTDIDGLIEYKNRGYVFLELKYLVDDMDRGQELALERLTDDLESCGKHCCCIIAIHTIKNPQEMIIAADTIVSRYRRNGVWKKPKTTLITSNLIRNFIHVIDEDMRHGYK